eukprot:3307150-Ditylum_brightwellii.AAC.3
MRLWDRRCPVHSRFGGGWLCRKSRQAGSRTVSKLEGLAGLWKIQRLLLGLPIEDVLWLCVIVPMVHGV